MNCRVQNCQLCDPRPQSDTCFRCAQSFYLTSDEKQCLPCNPGCLLCSERADRCQMCQNGHVFLFPSSCLEKCPPHFVAISFQSGEEICTPCDSTCLGCDGPTKNQCTSCKTGHYITENQQCMPCNQEGCLECTSTTVCSLCALGTFLNNGECLEECPSDTLRFRRAGRAIC